MSTGRRDPRRFRGLPLGRRRPWTLTVADGPAREYDIAPLALESARELMCEAAAPLLELSLRARSVHAQMVGDTVTESLADELRELRDVSATAAAFLRGALDAHGRDVGYSTRCWHERAAELTGAILSSQSGSFPAELAATAGLQLSCALCVAARDPMAVPSHLAAATGRADAVRALASALLPNR